MKADAEANGIPYRDEQGRYADLNALRYTWATFLQRNNIPQRYAMMLMRHSDIKLTSKVYTDESQLPVYDSIKELPRLLGCTQIRAQISGADGQNVAQTGATVTRETHSEDVENGALSRTLTGGALEIKMERAKGFESWPFFVRKLLIG